ncbi:MAG: hypothetical protein ACRDAI_05715 [Candidatus Rhabdochlamydia sp.]
MFNKKEELDDKELKSKLTVYNERDIGIDRTALSNQHLDDLRKAVEKGRKEIAEQITSKLLKEGFETDELIARQAVGRNQYKIVEMSSAIDMFAQRTGYSKEQIAEALRKK